MKLSIIVPVYNVQDYLAQCIESIVSQSVPATEYEIIIVNDETPDDSMKIAKQYQEKYKQIKIVDRKNGGIAAARNTGIEIAQGDYIALLDSDDFYSKDFFEELFNIIDEKPDLIIMDFNYFYMEDHCSIKENREFNIKDVNGINGIEVLDTILKKDPLFSWYPWAYVIKREMIVKNNLYFVPNRNYEDIFWTPLLFLHSKKMMYLDKPVLEYRLQRPGQITGTINLKNLSDPFYAPEYLEEKMEHLLLDRKLKERILNSVSNKYFKAPFYAYRIPILQRKILIERMIENKKLINNVSTPITKFISILMKILGVRITVEAVGLVHEIYRSLLKKDKKESI